MQSTADAVFVLPQVVCFTKHWLTWFICFSGRVFCKSAVDVVLACLRWCISAQQIMFTCILGCVFHRAQVTTISHAFSGGVFYSILHFIYMLPLTLYLWCFSFYSGGVFYSYLSLCSADYSAGARCDAARLRVGDQVLYQSQVGAPT